MDHSQSCACDFIFITATVRLFYQIEYIIVTDNNLYFIVFSECQRGERLLNGEVRDNALLTWVSKQRKSTKSFSKHKISSIKRYQMYRNACNPLCLKYNLW